MNIYEYKGIPHTVKQLSEISGIAPATIRDRIRRGYSVEQAIRITATNDGVEQFCSASSWEDWVGMSIEDVHQIYWRWSLSHGYTPISKQGFSRHLFSLNPWLKTVPTKVGNKCFRIVRKRD